MRNLKITTLVLAVLLLTIATSRAQVSRVSFSCAGSATGQVSISFGETFSGSGSFGTGSIKGDTIIQDKESVEDTKPETRVIIYPNPTENTVNIIVNGNYGNDFTLKISDITGKILCSLTHLHNTVSYSLYELKPGIYTVSTYTSSGELIINQSIIKQ
jgi:hypothetical protein